MLTAIYACSFISHAQNGHVEMIMKILGTENPESVDPDEAERLYGLLERPLRLNSASRSKISSAGILTGYQTASLLDYRNRHGDIMSLYELSLIDGFNSSVVETIAPFISLEGGCLGDTGNRNVENDLAVKGGLKLSGYEAESDYAVKYKTDIGGVASVGLALFSSDNHQIHGLGASYVSVYLRRLSAKMIAGDFNARFGQGLALWNGMTMSGLTSTGAFYRKASGLSTSWSYTGSSSLTGLAAEIDCGRLTFAPFLALPGIKTSLSKSDIQPLLLGLNALWRGRSMSLSCTHYSEFSDIVTVNGTYITDMKTSLDAASCLKGTDIFAEVAYDWVNAALAAVISSIIPVSDSWRLALNLRYYPSGYNSSRSAAPRSGSKCSDEAGVSICMNHDKGTGGRHKLDISVDAATFPHIDTYVRNQLKLYADWESRLFSTVLLKLRASERLRNWGHFARTDVRADLSWTPSCFSFGGRVNYLRCVGNAFLGYLEAGYKQERWTLWCRSGIFVADNWDDRIYVYERDAPGSFNVPAVYGRGVWLSVTGSWRFARWGRLYLRGSTTAYPFMIKKKPGKAELKLQSVFSF